MTTRRITAATATSAADGAAALDRETLLGHRAHWGVEPQPELRDLSRLTDREAALYDDLRHNTLGRQVRLEQEKIGFSWLERALETIEAAE